MDKQARQRTLLNLDKDFAIKPVHWPLLTARIEQLLQDSAPQQGELFDLQTKSPCKLTEEIEPLNQVT
jgi:hypothetical protein